MDGYLVKLLYLCLIMTIWKKSHRFEVKMNKHKCKKKKKKKCNRSHNRSIIAKRPYITNDCIIPSNEVVSVSGTVKIELGVYNVS